MDTKLPATFWIDPKFDKCDVSELLAVLWIKTNPGLDLLGSADASARNFEFHARMPFEHFERACQALGKGIVRDGTRYWLRDFIREQFGAGESLARNHMRKPLARAWSMCGSPSLKEEIAKEYPEVCLAENGSPYQAHAKGQSRTEQNISEQSRTEQSRAEGVQGESPQAPSTRPRSVKSGSSRPADHPAPMGPRMVAVADIFRRRPESVWSEAEKKALSGAGLVELTQDDFDDQIAVMRAFYRATIPEARRFEFCRRTGLATLLNNWPGELDKARSWRRLSGGEGDGVTKVA